MSNQQSSEGFTLIELMLTVVVAAVVLAVAAPSFTTMIKNNRATVLSEDVASALNFARSEAVKRADIVSLCASSDGATCSNNAAGWINGYIAFVDDAASETAAAPVVGTVLRVWDNITEGAVIEAQRGGADIHFIRYTGLGTLARIDDNAVQVSSEIEDCKGYHRTSLSIGLSGMVNVSKELCTE